MSTTFLSSLSLSLVALSLSLAACGGATSSVPEDGTATPTPSGGPSPSDPAPPSSPSSPPAPTPTTTPTTPPPTACHAVTADGAAIPITMVAADPPAPLGGTIVDGTYRLVDAKLYTHPGGSAGPLPITIKATIAISGTVANVAQDTSKSSERLTATVVTSGTSVTFTQTCPKGDTNTATYSGGTDLTLFLPNDQGQVVAYTYRR
ncbi:MAG TPA: hypothetical protein VLT33_04435 [Labilithrix sp.]|nr:hypothetical protein [Labilithrix sp.]